MLLVRLVRVQCLYPQCTVEPLCDECIDHLNEGGGPYEPTTRTRASRLLQRWFNKPLCITYNIAEFIIPYVER